MSEAEVSAPPAEVEAEAVPPPPSVGERLLAARQARGLSVAEAAQTLKLGVRQVEALESGNWQALPGSTFIRGFVRNYARLLGMDAAPLMAALDSVLEKPEFKLVAPPAQPGAALPQAGGAQTRRDRLVVLAGAALVALAALAYFLVPGILSGLRESAQGALDSLAHDSPPPAESAAQKPAEPAFPPGATTQQIISPQAQPAEETPAEAAEAAPAAGGEAAQLRLVVDKESWVEVRDRDNRLVFSQRLPAGAEQTLAGRAPLSLVLGYAPGVRLFWRGQAVDLAPYTRADVARLALE